VPAALASATYDAANRQTAFGAKVLTYDDNGNLTRITDGTDITDLTWDSRNRLTALSAPGTLAAFAYDALGRRASKTINGTTTEFQYDGLDMVRDVVGSTATGYLNGPGIDEPLVRGGSEFFWADALGSVLRLTDAFGAVATSYRYEPFGRATLTSGESTNPAQYTGRENDSTGLHYYRARYYHTDLQRFISEDPLGLVAGTNLYSYANNNPTNFADPLGLCRIEARFTSLSLGYYHAFVVTTDPNGTQNYYRGGPTPGQNPSGGSSGALSSASGGAVGASMRGSKSGSTSGNSSSPGSGPGGPGQNNGPWGQIVTNYGPYTPRTVDWDPAAISMTVLDNTAPCGPYDASFEQTMIDIQNVSIPYNAFTTNSNAVARETLERAGLSPGRPSVWAPGWNTRLP
jgi:RHS repeat-associated protein